MNVSERRIAANRRNAQQSTGPKTRAGKLRAAQNASKHGLTARLPAVGPEAEQARANRVAACRAQYAPRTPWEDWLIEELAGVTLKLGRVREVEVQVRESAATRAESDLWDEDRRREVETIAAKLARQPAQVVARLRQWPQGCDWLIDQWALLAQRADAAPDSGWNETETRLAHDLLGTPSVGRSGPIGLLITEQGYPAGPEVAPAELARRQIADLQAVRDLTAEVEEADRAAIEAGWSDLPNRDAVNLRRYEGSTFRRLYWIMDQIKAAGLTSQNRPHQPPASVAPLPTAIAAPVEPAATPEVAPKLATAKSEASSERAERTEPCTSNDHDETNPLLPSPAAVAVPPVTDSPTPKRPNLAKIAKRERKARRKRSRQRCSV